MSKKIQKMIAVIDGKQYECVPSSNCVGCAFKRPGCKCEEPLFNDYTPCGAFDIKYFPLDASGNRVPVKGKFLVEVTETYSSEYEIEADSREEAEQYAAKRAEQDNTITDPEHFDGRETRIVEG